MKKLVFDFVNYKPYLTNIIQNQPARGHGFRTTIAKALGWRAAYVTQVLSGGAQFSLEQAEALNVLFGHTEEEADYFLLIVQHERAGTHALKLRIKKQIEKFLIKRQILKERVDIKQTLSVESQARYYSHWYYAALHMLVTVDQYPTREAMANYLRLSVDQVGEVLEFLIAEGLVEFSNGKYRSGQSRLFLGNDSPNITKHHMNWRVQAIQSLDRNLKTDLHFSGVVSLASSDVMGAKEELIKGLESARTIVRNSKKEEEIYGMCIDFFKI